MSYINQIRNQLQLSQQQMADILGVDRSLITRAENGLKTISTSASNILFKLAGFADINAKHNYDNTELEIRLQRHQAKTLKEIKKRERVCLHKVTGLQFRLDSLSAAFYKTQIWRALVQQRLQELSPGEENKIQRLLLEYHLLKTQQKLVQCGLLEQKKLQVKIELLHAEVEIIKKWSKGLEDETITI